MSLLELAEILCWHCGDPLGDEDVVEASDRPGWLAHADCEAQHHPEGEPE
jgi:hypothetical protein